MSRSSDIRALLLRIDARLNGLMDIASPVDGDGDGKEAHARLNHAHRELRALRTIVRGALAEGRTS